MKTPLSGYLCRPCLCILITIHASAICKHLSRSSSVLLLHHLSVAGAQSHLPQACHTVKSYHYTTINARDCSSTTAQTLNASCSHMLALQPYRLLRVKAFSVNEHLCTYTTLHQRSESISAQTQNSQPAIQLACLVSCPVCMQDLLPSLYQSVCGVSKGQTERPISIPISHFCGAHAGPRIAGMDSD